MAESPIGHVPLGAAHDVFERAFDSLFLPTRLAELPTGAAVIRKALDSGEAASYSESEYKAKVVARLPGAR